MKVALFLLAQPYLTSDLTKDLLFMISSNKKTHKKQQYCDLIEQYKLRAITTKKSIKNSILSDQCTLPYYFLLLEGTTELLKVKKKKKRTVSEEKATEAWVKTLLENHQVA